MTQHCEPQTPTTTPASSAQPPRLLDQLRAAARAGRVGVMSRKTVLPARSAAAACSANHPLPSYSEPRSNGFFVYSTGTDISGSNSWASARRRPTART